MIIAKFLVDIVAMECAHQWTRYSRQRALLDYVSKPLWRHSVHWIILTWLLVRFASGTINMMNKIGVMLYSILLGGLVAQWLGHQICHLSDRLVPTCASCTHPCAALWCDAPLGPDQMTIQKWVPRCMYHHCEWTLMTFDQILCMFYLHSLGRSDYDEFKHHNKPRNCGLQSESSSATVCSHYTSSTTESSNANWSTNATSVDWVIWRAYTSSARWWKCQSVFSCWFKSGSSVATVDGITAIQPSAWHCPQGVLLHSHLC